MSRLVGDSPTYRFSLMRLDTVQTKNGPIRKWKATDHTFDLPSVSLIKDQTLGIPSGAMSWHGYRVAIEGMKEILRDPEALVPALDDPELLEEHLRERGCDPNKSLTAAADRGSKAHDIFELIANGKRDEAEELAKKELIDDGTQYGRSVITAWNQEYQGAIDSGQITEVLTELPVWSLRYGYGGQFDLAVRYTEGWSIDDLKTHKPADGYTKEGGGPAYLSDLVQARLYRMAWEEMGLGPTIGNRIIVARDREYRGKSYVPDNREVSVEFVEKLLEFRELKLAQGVA